MNKHHDQLTEQFQLLMNVRNEVKQAIDASRTPAPNGKQILCLTEIDAWERETIQRIQKIAKNARNNVNELMMEHMNKIANRFEQTSVQMQQQQKEGVYLETDIERLSNQLDQLKNDIKHANEKIRVDFSQSNNIQWDTLLYIVEGESLKRITFPPMTMSTIEVEMDRSEERNDKHDSLQSVLQKKRLMEGK